MRIDAHQHFWHYDPVSYGWIDESMAAIQQDYLPQNLQPVLQEHGFDGCVVVQTEQTEESNDSLLSWASAHSFIRGVVGWTDLTAPDVQDRLAGYQQHRIIKGFRHVLQGEQDRAYMLRPDFRNGIAALKTYGFTYDILIFPDQLPFTETFVKAFPDQPFVIDHLAKPYIKRAEIADWKADLQKMAAFPNVCCKVSGMVTEADWKGWKKEDFRPYLDAVVEAFGTERLLYGSDWPVCLVAASYSEMLAIAEGYFSAFTASEKEAVFGGNAVRFYQLS